METVRTLKKISVFAIMPESFAPFGVTNELAQNPIMK